jgi:hypothetical protein
VGSALAKGKGVFRTRTRSVRRVAQQLHRLARRKGAEAQEQVRQAYERLLAIVHQSQHQAQRVCTVLRTQSGDRARRLVQRFEQVLPLVAQVVRQTTRRVLQGESVPAPAKLVSLFEPHTQILQRHKPGKAVEFGRKLWLDEVEGGLISRYALLPSAGADAPYLADSLAGHKERFGKAPWLVAGDRGVATPDNEALAKKEGVKRVVLPRKGRLSAQRRRYEQQRWFRRGFRFRAGSVVQVMLRCGSLLKNADIIQCATEFHLFTSMTCITPPSPEGEAKHLERLGQPAGAPRIRGHYRWQPFAENLLGTGGLGTQEVARLEVQAHGHALPRQISHGSPVAAMHPC